MQILLVFNLFADGIFDKTTLIVVKIINIVFISSKGTGRAKMFYAIY